jgi:Protein of unknown function (DUF2591)
MKTRELYGRALDWAVAKAEGYIDDPDSWLYHAKSTSINNYFPSTDWALAGLIIDREKISTYIHPDMSSWMANLSNIRFCCEGPTPLIAAMRCYVFSKLGSEIMIPEVLK